MQLWEPESVVAAAREQRLLVVTGIMAAGKSTVARMLATQFQRGVHVEADTLQRMIVSGGVWVDQPGEPAGEAARQLRLRLHHLCQLGRSFYSAGFSVVLDDIIIGERWSELQDELRGLPFALIVLAPSQPAVWQRDLKREKPPQDSAWIAHLDRELRRTMTGVGLWVDSSDQTPEETVRDVLDRLPPPGRGDSL
jgi:predicted kinase